MFQKMWCPIVVTIGPPIHMHNENVACMDETHLLKGYVDLST